MFNDGFYPSTPEVIELMIAPFVFDSRRDYYTKKRVLRGVKRILEPSAGKGDIADYITNEFEVKKEDILCCEIEPELVSILQGKGYPVIERDFRNLVDPYQFDVVLMNPPFRDASTHILKAWDVLRIFGGEIVSQVNAETIRNPTGFDDGVLATLIEKYGSVEFIGRPYKSAQRTTSVEVAIVRLKREALGNGVSFGGSGDYEQDTAEGGSSYEEFSIASTNMLESIVSSYNAARQVVIDKSELSGRFYFYTKTLNDKPTGTPEDIVRKQKEADKSERDNRAIALNKDLDSLKARFWNYLLNRTKIADIATSKVQAEFKNFVANTNRMAFTVANIMQVFEMLTLQRDQIRSECITSTFDKMTSYDTENKIHPEGWVTNDAYKVNKKVILPIRAARWGGEWETYWDSAEEAIANDIDKAICFVEGRAFTSIRTIYNSVIETVRGIRSASRWNEKTGAAPQIESEFFRIRIFKKGTIHITFKDDDVWERFNVEAAKGKNWIGAQTEHKYRKTQTKRCKTVDRAKEAAFCR